MVSKNWLLLILLLLIICIVATVLYAVPGALEPEIEIVVRKNRYDKEENLQLKITNNLKKNICFSSCYPYYLESSVNGEQWQVYQYDNCPWEDIIEKCMSSQQIRAFELSLNGAKEGHHRIVIPVCENCQEGQNFKETKKVYSPIFEIN